MPDKPDTDHEADELGRTLLEDFNDNRPGSEPGPGPVPALSGPGRPEIGKPVLIRFGDLQARLDQWADQHGVNRAEAARQLVARALDAYDAEREAALTAWQLPPVMRAGQRVVWPNGPASTEEDLFGTVAASEGGGYVIDGDDGVGYTIQDHWRKAEVATGNPLFAEGQRVIWPNRPDGRDIHGRVVINRDGSFYIRTDDGFCDVIHMHWQKAE